MLHTRGALTESTKYDIVGLLAHDAMFISFCTGIKAENRGCRTKVFDEGPASACCSDEIGWVGVSIEPLMRCVMLKDEIHLKGYFSNTLED